MRATVEEAVEAVPHPLLLSQDAPLSNLGVLESVLSAVSSICHFLRYGRSHRLDGKFSSLGYAFFCTLGTLGTVLYSLLKLLMVLMLVLMELLACWPVVYRPVGPVIIFPYQLSFVFWILNRPRSAGLFGCHTQGSCTNLDTAPLGCLALGR